MVMMSSVMAPRTGAASGTGPSKNTSLTGNRKSSRQDDITEH